MARRTKEQLRIDRNIKRIDELVSSLKFLANPSYYKNNFWSMAAWDSWANQGKAGSCGCGCGNYQASLNNTRRSTRKGGRKEHCKYVFERICTDCISIIENKIGVQFKRRY